jgi:glycerophosphoryl diester phosphodiesterase
MLQVLASQRDGYPLISAHRGASKSAPGNTMAAFEQAWQLGSPMIELDVQLSQDKHVVVIHDEQLQFTTNGHGPVHEHTLAALKALDAGAWFDPQYVGQQILTLDEVAAWSKGKIGLNIEIKGTATTLADLPERV